MPADMLASADLHTFGQVNVMTRAIERVFQSKHIERKCTDNIDLIVCVCLCVCLFVAGFAFYVHTLLPE